MYQNFVVWIRAGFERDSSRIQLTQTPIQRDSSLIQYLILVEVVRNVRIPLETFECNGVNTCLLAPSMPPSGFVISNCTSYIHTNIKMPDKNCPASIFNFNVHEVHELRQERSTLTRSTLHQILYPSASIIFCSTLLMNQHLEP